MDLIERDELGAGQHRRDRAAAVFREYVADLGLPAPAHVEPGHRPRGDPTTPPEKAVCDALQRPRAIDLDGHSWSRMM
jgi:hypothetical protein